MKFTRQPLTRHFGTPLSGLSAVQEKIGHSILILFASMSSVLAFNRGEADYPSYTTEFQGQTISGTLEEIWDKITSLNPKFGFSDIGCWHVITNRKGYGVVQTDLSNFRSCVYATDKANRMHYMCRSVDFETNGKKIIVHGSTDCTGDQFELIDLHSGSKSTKKKDKPATGRMFDNLGDAIWEVQASKDADFGTLEFQPGSEVELFYWKLVESARSALQEACNDVKEDLIEEAKKDGKGAETVRMKQILAYYPNWERWSPGIHSPKENAEEINLITKEEAKALLA